MALKSKLLAGTIFLLVSLAFLFWIRPWSSNAAIETPLYGNVDVRELQLAFRTSGRLQSMNVEEGDLVATGDSLASLDSGPAEGNVKIADAELAHAEAQLASIRAGSRPQEIAQARAAVRDAQAAFDDAQRGAERQAQLLRTQSTSRTLLESAQTLRESAAARLVSAEEALALAAAGARPQDIKAAEALVAVVQAQRDQAARTLADTVLTAPTAGIISTRIYEPGSMLAIGQSVYTLALTDQLYVRAYAEEPMLSSIAPGTQVSIHTDNGARYTGQIGFISPSAEFTPKTVQTPELRTSLVYRLRILVKDADQGLRQGMPVTIVLPDVMP
ncbi:HlyD family efflux transporter periplasmic adaptor subunit [Granulosicoccus antarcticus]|uniref:Putative multidrug resistance protein EmrK n=1 Tax=Granulosicoccus antarcticus IMCC3135 TaxID=1192854 RepID=A0A2Z2NN56_9GAMM|nr:HlyD family efflux transporter periplasmic adaptor subunit [Granulosicoccus antarcticus]ASJ72659.1 putative multidrug resistance protein EmrK [Granulosicoccus antarcticus IMCC3135]